MPDDPCLTNRAIIGLISVLETPPAGGWWKWLTIPSVSEGTRGCLHSPQAIYHRIKGKLRLTLVFNLALVDIVSRAQSRGSNSRAAFCPSSVPVTRNWCSPGHGSGSEKGSVCRLTVLQGSLGDTNVPAQVLHQADRFGLAGCSNSVVVCSAVGCYKFLVDLANIVWFTQPKHNQVRITLA